jgi:Holliday junction DNA helicase RuvA
LIERLSGTIAYRDGSHVILDVAGVGYGVDTTDGAAGRLAPDTAATLWIYTDVRDDDIKLFGFPTLEERILFTQLISAPGVGAKLAMAMLSHLGGHAIVASVLADEADRLKQVPGIAAKAKEIQLHLKRRLSKLEDDAWLGRLMSRAAPTAASGGLGLDQPLPVGAAAGLPPQLLTDLRSALANLGYKEKEIQSTLKSLAAAPGEVSFASLLRRAIATLSAPEARRGAAHEEQPRDRALLDEVF